MQSYALENVPVWALGDVSALGRIFLFSRSRAQEVDEDEKLVAFSALVADEKGSSKGAQLRQQFGSLGPTSSTYRCQLWVQ